MKKLLISTAMELMKGSYLNHLIHGMVKNDLKVFDIANDSLFSLAKAANGANVASTPLLNELDGDGFLEVVFAQENNLTDLLSLTGKTGLFIHMLKTEVPVYKPILWDSYMGSGSNGVFIGNEQNDALGIGLTHAN